MESTRRAVRRNNELGRQRGTGSPEKRPMKEASYGEEVNRLHLALYFNSRPARNKDKDYQ